MEITQNNISTVIMWAYVVLTPYISQYISQEQFLQLSWVLIGVAGAIWSSKNPNTIQWLGNASKEQDDDMQ